MFAHIRFDWLVFKSTLLGNNFPVMPLDELSLSVAFAALPNQKEVVTRLMRELFNHENMHVRRIAIEACRRSGVFDVSGLKEALEQKLSDPEEWVQYVAIRAIEEAGFDNPEIMKKLILLAANTNLPEDELRTKDDPSNVNLKVRIQARKTLDAIAKIGLNRN